MIEAFLIGRFIPGNSFLHKMDPCCKFIIVSIYTLLLVSTKNIGELAIHTSAVCAAVSISRIPLFYLWGGLKGIFWIATISALFQLLIHSDGKLVLAAGNVEVHEEGLIRGALIFGRMILLILCISLLTLTTSSTDLSYGIAAFFRPFQSFGFPSDRFAFMIVISMRFVPVFLQEIDRIAIAQKARNRSIRSTGIFDRLHRISSVFVPAFAHLYRRAEQLSIIMEARGYRGDVGRIRRKSYRYGWRDAVGLITVVADVFATFLFGST